MRKTTYVLCLFALITGCAGTQIRTESRIIEEFRVNGLQMAIEATRDSRHYRLIDSWPASE